MDDQMSNLEVVGENLRWYLHIYINDKSYCLSKDNPSFNIELPKGKHTMTVKKEKLSLNFLKIITATVSPLKLPRRACRQRNFSETFLKYYKSKLPQSFPWQLFLFEFRFNFYFIISKNSCFVKSFAKP